MQKRDVVQSLYRVKLRAYKQPYINRKATKHDGMEIKSPQVNLGSDREAQRSIIQKAVNYRYCSA